MCDLATSKIRLDLGESISSKAYISKDAVLEGNNEIGAGAKILGNSRIKNSIIWDNIEIPEGSVIEDSIIGPNYKLEASEAISNKVLAKLD